MKNTHSNPNKNKYITYLLSAALLVAVFEGCRKETDETSDVSPKQSSDAFKILATPSYKGVYVDNFVYMVGDTSQENTLLRWCKKNSLNALSLYDTKSLLNTPSSYDRVAKFIKKAKTQYGIKSMAAVRERASQFTGSTMTYNNSRIDTVERFNTFNLENEYWNTNTSTTTFGDWIKIVNTMNTTAHAAVPRITSEFYFGWFENPINKESSQAAKMVAATDRILLHDYWATPSLSYMQSRLTFLGQEAYKQNKTIDIIVLFSVEPSFAYDYFDEMTQNHTFLDAYNQILAQHNASSFAGKDNIRIIGYQLFCQTFARRARP